MSPPVRTVPGDRWSCHACGACCRLYELGPVEPEVIAGIERAGLAASWPPAAEGWHERRTGVDGTSRAFLTHRDGHCVFLADDNRCAVHAALGEAAKPGFCREYPFHLVDRGEDTALVVRPSCAGYHAATGDTPVVDQVIATLALPRVLPVRRRVPASVEIAPGRTLPWATWAPIEAELLGLLPLKATGGTSLQALQAIRAHLATRFDLPLGADAERARLAGGAVIEGLRRIMEAATRDGTADPHRRAFATQAEETLRRALHRLGSPRPMAPEADAWNLRLLHGFLLARWYLGVGGVPEGLAVFTLQTRLVQAQGTDDPVTLAQAGPIVTLWTKLTENAAVLAFLQRARPALWDLWIHLPE